MAKIMVTAEQAAYFTKNGILELEIETPTIQGEGRDLWRKNPALEKFLTRTLSPIAFTLTNKAELMIGCDQVFKEKPTKAGLLKELFSLQGLAIVAAISPNAKALPRTNELGIIPAPKPGHILFFKPNLIIDWPHLEGEVYLAVFALPTAVYVRNAQDPHTNALRAHGYHFGDRLKNPPLR